MTTTLRALSLFQPYATGVAIGAKTWETRSRRTHYRGPLLICSTASTPRKVLRAALALPVIREALLPPGLALMGPSAAHLPWGVVLAVVDLVACYEMAIRPNLAGCQGSVWPDARERAWGDWRPGRFAWKLENVRRLPRPIPVKGRQGIWTPSPELVAAVVEQVGPVEVRA